MTNPGRSVFCLFSRERSRLLTRPFHHATFRRRTQGNDLWFETRLRPNASRFAPGTTPAFDRRGFGEIWDLARFVPHITFFVAVISRRVTVDFSPVASELQWNTSAQLSTLSSESSKPTRRLSFYFLLSTSKNSRPSLSTRASSLFPRPSSTFPVHRPQNRRQNEHRR